MFYWTSTSLSRFDTEQEGRLREEDEEDDEEEEDGPCNSYQERMKECLKRR